MKGGPFLRGRLRYLLGGRQGLLSPLQRGEAWHSAGQGQWQHRLRGIDQTLPDRKVHQDHGLGRSAQHGTGHRASALQASAGIPGDLSHPSRGRQRVHLVPFPGGQESDLPLPRPDDRDGGHHLGEQREARKIKILLPGQGRGLQDQDGRIPVRRRYQVTAIVSEVINARTASRWPVKGRNCHPRGV